MRWLTWYEKLPTKGKPPSPVEWPESPPPALMPPVLRSIRLMSRFSCEGAGEISYGGCFTAELDAPAVSFHLTHPSPSQPPLTLGLVSVESSASFGEIFTSSNSPVL